MLLCKTCHGEFDNEKVLNEALSEDDEIFWVCIFANDIGAAPKSGNGDSYHLSVETVRKMNVKDIPVRYGHTSDPIGRVLFGWHIHWPDRPTFACASISTIKRAPFEMGAPVLLTVACQSSLGTVNGVPDEISITQIGARNDTVGLFCRRDSLRQVLTHFRYFTETDASEPIKQNCRRASGFGRSSMSSASTTTTATTSSLSVHPPMQQVHTPEPTPTSQPQPQQPQPLPPIQTEQQAAMEDSNGALQDNADDSKVSEVEEVARQVREIRQELADQSAAMNMTRGLLEEASLKCLSELRASEAPGATKVRQDVERMVAKGVIRNPDNPSQPRIGDADAIQTLVEFNMNQFPAAIAKSFRDTVQNILEPPSSSSTSSDSKETIDDDILPSIGSSLVAVRATALRAKAAREGNSTINEPVRASSLGTVSQRPPKKSLTQLGVIHRALAEKLAPGRRRYRDTSWIDGEDEQFRGVTPTKLQKMIQNTVRNEMRQWSPASQHSEEEDKRRELFNAFEQFYTHHQQQQVSKVKTETNPQQASSGSPTIPVPVAAPESSPTPLSTQPPKQQSVIRASGVKFSLPPSMDRPDIPFNELALFY